IFNFEICRLEIFRNALSELIISKLLDHLRFIPVNSNFVKTNEGNYSYFPKTYTRSRAEQKWRYINYGKVLDFSVIELRRALIAQFQFNGHLIYLLEAERRLVPSDSG